MSRINGGGSEFLGKLNKRGEVKINGAGVGNSRKRRSKRFNVKHKVPSKLGITALGQAGEVQCDNGPKIFQFGNHIRLNIFDLKMRGHCTAFVNKERSFSFQ